jgi:hypothetical protein
LRRREHLPADDVQGELDRTTDGGATATTITASSVPLAGAAFRERDAGGRRGRGRPDGGSGDAGVDYVPVGGDIGGRFSLVRRGPVASSAFALAAKGQVAFTLDGGASWKVATSRRPQTSSTRRGRT